MTVAKNEQKPPEVIAGRYKIETRLGQGGMGSVWKAMHLSLRSPVAVKLIDPSLASSEEAVARFLREAQSAAALRSPHVVQILDHGVDAGVPYIAMELLEGESLAERLARLRVLGSAETARVMTHVARAMSRAHEAGIVHRDLKPANVFLVRNDDEEIAKVLDFGIAKATTNAFDVTTGTRTGEMLGTPYYMSPEQVEGQKALDHRTDLWAMAVMTFECLLGGRPFESDTLGSLLLQICSKPIPVPSQRGPVPYGFDAWFERATQRAPEDRFQSARELADSLRAVLVPGSAPATGLATPPRTVARVEQAVAKAPDAPASVVRRSAVPGLRSARPIALLFALLCGVALLGAAWALLRPSERTKPASEPATAAKLAPEPAMPQVAQPAQASAAPPTDNQAKQPAKGPAVSGGGERAATLERAPHPAAARITARAHGVLPTRARSGPAQAPEPRSAGNKPDLGF